jgi:hypothetical protein
MLQTAFHHVASFLSEPNMWVFAVVFVVCALALWWLIVSQATGAVAQLTASRLIGPSQAEREARKVAEDFEKGFDEIWPPPSFRTPAAKGFGTARRLHQRPR